jgi:hypothetical protein
MDVETDLFQNAHAVCEQLSGIHCVVARGRQIFMFRLGKFVTFFEG